MILISSNCSKFSFCEDESSESLGGWVYRLPPLGYVDHVKTGLVPMHGIQYYLNNKKMYQEAKGILTNKSMLNLPAPAFFKD